MEGPSRTDERPDVLHLARRFFGSLRPGPPDPADEAWAIGHLLPGEIDVWRRMGNPDRRHAVGVARAVVARFGDGDPAALPDRAVVAAALLHDCGKVVSGLRTPARVAATVVWASSDDEEQFERWLARDGGLRHRLAQYRNHPELGREVLAAAGSDEVTAAWAAEHHLPEDAWTVPADIGRLLKACDDD